MSPKASTLPFLVTTQQHDRISEVPGLPGARLKTCRSHGDTGPPEGLLNGPGAYTEVVGNGLCRLASFVGLDSLSDLGGRQLSLRDGFRRVYLTPKLHVTATIITRIGLNLKLLPTK